MISNERPSPFGNRSYGANPPRQQQHHYQQTTEQSLRSEKIQIERKTFIISLKENSRGRFLRITEDVGGRRDTIIVPTPGLKDFQRIIDEMVRLAAELPEQAPRDRD